MPLDVLTTGLLALLSTAFVAWAGVVWQASRNVQKSLQSFVVAAEQRLTRVETRVDYLERDIHEL